MSITNPSDSKYIQLPADASQHQGQLRSDGSGGYMRSYSDWINGANRPEVSPYWLNPYVNTIGQGDGDGREGATRISNAWINSDTVGIQTSKDNSNPNPENQPAGIGWLRVTETTIEGGGSVSIPSIISTQPLNAEVKINCQTPGATITYTSTPTTTTPNSGPFGLKTDNNGRHPVPPTVTMPGTSSTSYTDPFPLGSANNTDGLLYGIRAQAAKSGSTSEPAYEKAARSVIRFNNIASAKNWSNNDNLTNQAAAKARELHLWLRGGDGLSGSSLTPGFPLSWSDQDYTGARLMTKDGATNNWYWITWEISSQAYFHFVAGTTSTAAQAANGPHDWAWGKNAWAFQHAEFPLYAGGSLVFSTATTVTHPATETFEFYEAFSGSRP